MMQRFTDYEVWIIDGASTDGTQEYLKTLDQRFNFISEEDSGIYNAMNKGIEKSKGEWLYFLGADDKFLSNQKLRIVLHTFVGMTVLSLKMWCSRKMVL